MERLRLKIVDTESDDQWNGFFKNVNTQIDEAHNLFKQDSKLANGFNAVGFSQGGQFLRAYVQRYNDPPVVNLISIGGQHQGVFGFPHCPGTNYTLCEYLRSLLDWGAYNSWVQSFVVQAEYWHDPNQIPEYLKDNIFLPDINNEIVKNNLYKERLTSLQNFVMVKFLQDTMVQPRESEWFGFYAEGQDKVVLPLQQTKLYTEDWLGLKQMASQGKLHFLSVDGDHLQFTKEWFLSAIVQPFLNTNSSV
eukprot:TRINITY_DN869_c0_g2_i6.p1 TRINITY_DN869_c0_g2~~TRINITY_DN869_c0_g2_i6.p1  ORF type:complete len:249 (-),score=47.04 TRINITY_DN869_c0_g2_i6:69-815(-)